MNYEKFTSGRGGKREGAGRPKGTIKEKTVTYYRRIHPEFVKAMDEYLELLKQNKMLIMYILIHIPVDFC